MYYADLITLGQEVDFPTELSRSSEALIWQNLVHIASRELIIAMKRQAGREVDLNDVARLESCG